MNNLLELIELYFLHVEYLAIIIVGLFNLPNSLLIDNTFYGVFVLLSFIYLLSCIYLLAKDSFKLVHFAYLMFIISYILQLSYKKYKKEL